MNVILIPLLELLDIVLRLYQIVIIAWVIMSWLHAFNIINAYSPAVRVVTDILGRLTAPALRPIQRFIPSVGGIDLSPLVLLLAVFFLRNFLRNLAVSLVA